MACVAIDGSAVGAEPSGARTRLVNLLAAYAALKRRHDVQLFVARGSGIDADLAARGAAGIRCIAVPPPAPAALRLFTARRAWPGRLRACGAALFQQETLPVAVLPPDAPPSLLTLHDLRALELPESASFARRVYARRMLPRALASVAVVIAVSEHTKGVACVRLGVDPAKVVVVPNAPDPRVRRVADPARLARFRARFGLGDAPFVLALGHIERRKNLGVLVDAVSRLRARPALSAVRLVLAGADRDGERARIARHEAAAAGMVAFTGVLDDDDRAAAYGAATCLAIPSLVEGFGIVPLEAMACGCPVVAARAAALPEVVGGAALLADPRDPAAWAAALERVFTGGRLAVSLAERGLRHAATFSWERSARLLLAVHDDVSDRGQRGRGQPVRHP